jgi:hypothetical protein
MAQANLSFTAEEIDEILRKASTGGGEVYIGDTEPTNEKIVLWIDTSDGDTGSSGGSDDTGGDGTEVTLSSISATYTGGNVTVGTALTSLTGLTVKATYSDGSTSNVTGYTLSGTIAEGSNTITVSYGGKTTTFTVTGVADTGGDTGGETTGRLPSEYQEVEYIETKKQLFNSINTGVQIKNVSKIKIGLHTDFSNYVRISDASTNATDNTGASANSEPYIYNTLDKTEITGKGYDSFSVEANPQDYVGNTVYVDFTFNTSSTSEKYYIFGDSSTVGWNVAVRKFYYIELYDSSNELLCNLIPCYRKSDNKVGMYDIVRNTFFTPLNGDFTKGGDV